MVRTTLALAFSALLITAAQAANYPIDGRWGVTASTEKGPVDCGKLRVITFNGNQRSDNGGGVPTYRNRTVQSLGSKDFRITDEFSTGQISGAKANFTLKIVEADRVEMNQQPGGLLKLRKCK